VASLRLASQLYLRDARTAADTFRPFAERAKSEPGWRYYELDASHSPNVTAPEALMTLLQKIRFGAGVKIGGGPALSRRTPHL